MGKNNTSILMQLTALAMVLTVAMLVKEAESISDCNVNLNDFEKCRPAVSGRNSPPPGSDCCAVVKAADLECACKYKNYFIVYGIKLAKVKAVIDSCSAKIPSCIRR
ncbi:hypothetical protein AALP_AA8G339100 [Arabis alpina]|uniref:Bifunctional inhibitor/plant lipid transfer protein/seed storage helical domain-containing protein n=1 Tax=Arabis alpina TaxID=50452 RepID=A0A087GB80_ARAAL|nr:hypothetical protein AALP_AA8G339100 [Arabis alpina]